MEHKFFRVKAFRYLGKYEVELEFDDEAVRKIDFEPILIGPLWGELRDPDLFKQMYLDEEVGTIVWPNGADFDPDTLYRWDDVVEALRNQLRSA